MHRKRTLNTAVKKSRCVMWSAAPAARRSSACRRVEAKQMTEIGRVYHMLRPFLNPVHYSWQQHLATVT